MMRTLFVIAMAIVGCYSSSSKNVLFELFRNKTSSTTYNTLSLQAIPEQSVPFLNCTKDHIAQLSKQYKLGDEFTCNQDKQEWNCIVRKSGYACTVFDSW